MRLERRGKRDHELHDRRKALDETTIKGDGVAHRRTRDVVCGHGAAHLVVLAIELHHLALRGLVALGGAHDACERERAADDADREESRGARDDGVARRAQRREAAHLGRRVVILGSLLLEEVDEQLLGPRSAGGGLEADLRGDLVRVEEVVAELLEARERRADSRVVARVREDHDLEPVLGPERAQVVEVLPGARRFLREERAERLPFLEVGAGEAREAQLRAAKVRLPERLSRAIDARGGYAGAEYRAPRGGVRRGAARNACPRAGPRAAR
jgi:hypothetical protein